MQVLNKVLMTDDASPKKAFYWFCLIQDGKSFIVQKESGASGRTLDCRSWPQPSRAEAEKFFNSIVKRKTNPARKSKRHYQKADQQLSLF